MIFGVKIQMRHLCQFSTTVEFKVSFWNLSAARKCYNTGLDLETVVLLNENREVRKTII